MKSKKDQWLNTILNELDQNGAMEVQELLAIILKGNEPLNQDSMRVKKLILHL